MVRLNCKKNTSHMEGKVGDDKCINCNKIVMCLGGCPYKRFKGIENCNKNMFEGMSIEEVLKLQVYYDIKNNNIKEENII